MLRIDPANTILGLRLNVWTAMLTFALGAALLVALRQRYQKDPEVNSISLPGAVDASTAKSGDAVENDEEEQNPEGGAENPATLSANSADTVNESNL